MGNKNKMKCVKTQRTVVAKFLNHIRHESVVIENGVELPELSIVMSIDFQFKPMIFSYDDALKEIDRRKLSGESSPEQYSYDWIRVMNLMIKGSLIICDLKLHTMCNKMVCNCVYDMLYKHYKTKLKEHNRFRKINNMKTQKKMSSKEFKSHCEKVKRITI